MHNYPYNIVFWDYHLKLLEMKDMHSKYENIHKNGMFNALI